ncbi:MAG: queuosine precursor transporter [Gammaproteobacteria bacterium]|nr:queuosine precursor transporter [Gammaproteobacteria bacterium]
MRKDQFDAIFGSAKIMYIASLVAYLVGQLSDIAVFRFFKRLTGERLVWLRATGSTVISQFIDSFIVSHLAFSSGASCSPIRPIRRHRSRRFRRSRSPVTH